MGKTMRGLSTLFFLLAVTGIAAGATVTMQNGDRLTGEIHGVADGRLQLKTDHMGTVALDLKAVENITSEEPVAVFLADGARVTGRLDTAEAGRILVVGDSGARTAKIVELAGIAVAPAEAASDLDRAIEVLSEDADEAPSPWKAKIEFGADYSAGNTDRQGVHAVFTAVREMPDDIFSVKAAAYYAEEDDVRSVNEQHLRFREDIKFDDWYVFALLSFERDEFEDLDLRVIFSPGVGHILADGEKFKAKAEVGPSLTYEKYRSGGSDTIFQVRIGFYAEAQVLEAAKLTEDLEIYPGLTGGSMEFRLESETAFENPLSENLFFKLSLRYDYNTDVADGVKNWDLKILASLVYEF